MLGAWNPELSPQGLPPRWSSSLHKGRVCKCARPAGAELCTLGLGRGCGSASNSRSPPSRAPGGGSPQAGVSLCVHTCMSASGSSFFKDTGHCGLGPTPGTAFYLFQDCVQTGLCSSKGCEDFFHLWIWGWGCTVQPTSETDAKSKRPRHGSSPTVEAQGLTEGSGDHASLYLLDAGP